MFHWLYGISHFFYRHIQHIWVFWGWRVKIKSENEKEIWVRIRLLKADSVLRCGCGAATEQCQPGHSGSSPAAYHHGKPPPPDELLPHGSPPPAAVDWPPDDRSQIHLRWKVAIFSVFLYIKITDVSVPFIQLKSECKQTFNMCNAQANSTKI